MAVLIKNNARSTLATAISSVDTLIRVRVGHGEMFPLPKGDDEWFPLTIEDDSGNIEIVRAFARNGDAISVERHAEDTQPRAFLAGVAVELRPTAAMFEDLRTGGKAAKVLVAVSDASLEGK